MDCYPFHAFFLHRLESRETLFGVRGDFNTSLDVDGSMIANQPLTSSDDNQICILRKGSPVCHGDVAILGRLLALGSSADYDGIVRIETELVLFLYKILAGLD